MISTATKEYAFIVEFFLFIIILDILAIRRVRNSSKQEVPHTYMHESNLVGDYMQQYSQPYQQYGQNYAQPQYNQYNNNSYAQGGQYGSYQNAYRTAPNGYGTYRSQNSYGQPQTYTGTTYAQPQQTAYQAPPVGKIFCSCCGSACRPNAFYCSICGKPLMR